MINCYYTCSNKKNKKVSTSLLVPSASLLTSSTTRKIQHVLFIILPVLLLVHCVVEAAFMSSSKITSLARSAFNTISIQSKFTRDNSNIKPIVHRMSTFTSKAQKQDENDKIIVSTIILQEEIYNIKNGMWRCQKEWNWGSSIGTGHDCAKICRNLYKTKISRQNLVQVQNLASQKYEQQPIKGNQLLLKDLIEYYPTINPSPVQLVEMTQLIVTQQTTSTIMLENENDQDTKHNENFTIRRCCALVLDTIQFIPNGL